MKKFKFLSTQSILMMFLALVFFSCEKDTDEIIPVEEANQNVLDEASFDAKTVTGTEMTISVFQPVPIGWVIVRSQPGVNLRIKYTIGYSAGKTLKIKNFSPIPQGWVIVNSQPGVSLTIKNTLGYSIGKTLKIKNFSPIPQGWVIISSQPGVSLTIRFVG